MKHRGQVRKLLVRMTDPVDYVMSLGDEHIAMKALFGKVLSLRHTGKITCIHCARVTNKSFSQGYCYPCFQQLAQCDSCIISPERCHYAAGTCREPVWGDHFCMQDHIVYLANSSGIKVGITRASQVPTRWMDQGATQALAVLRTRSRQHAGFCEVMFRQYVPDRTNWRSMLKGEQEAIDLPAERDRLLDACRQELADLQDRFGIHAIAILAGLETVEIRYPLQSLPEKIASLDPETADGIRGTLLGIKGQYLVLDSGVINIRKYTGYEFELEY